MALIHHFTEMKDELKLHAYSGNVFCLCDNVIVEKMTKNKIENCLLYVLLKGYQPLNGVSFMNVISINNSN